jgi:hypothetical protein
MSSTNNNNNNNNNNNGRSHNRYVIPVAGPSAAATTIPIGGYRRPVAVAAKHSGRKAPIRRATTPVARVPSPVASSNIPSAGASNGSYNSAPAERTSGYIHRGRIVPLPKADKLRKAPSHGPSCARIVRADPAEVQTFRAGLKAGRNSPLVSGNFPPLVPSHFLKTQEDARKNAGLSFSSIAAKGVKPGAKITLRSPTSSLPSWSETWMKNEDWVLVPPGQEDLLQRGLGSGFRLQFAGDLWEGICEVDEMAPRNGASGDFRLGLVERWLKEQALIRELVECSVYPPEYIELIGASGQVDKMYRLASRKQKPATPPKKHSPAPPSPPKLVPSSSSEFPTRKDKGKGKARDVYISESERKKLQLKLDRYKELHRNPNSLMEKPLSTSEEDEFIKKLASEVTDQIRGVMSFTETPKLDYVINQALAGDTWYSKPDNDDTIAEDWFKGLINDLSDVEPAKKNQPTKADKLVKSKPLPPSSYIKKKNQIAPIYNDAHKCAVVETIGREVRMAERYAIQKGDSFDVNLQAWGYVKHTKQNPLWEVPGFCYLAAINIAIPCDKPWPANPTVQQMSRFGYKYRKLQPFKLVETIQGQHYTLKMGKATTYRDNSGWRLIDYLAKNEKFYMRVGGDGDKTDVKTLDGTNYQQWAPKMRAYLMSKELWYYVNGETKRPSCIVAPIAPVPEEGATTVTASATAAYRAVLKTYNEQREVQLVWDRADNKALGIIQLRMADKLQYLIKDTSLLSWANIKSQFDVSGPAAIFVDFKFVINFKFDDRKEPAVQVAELNTRLNRLATHGFNLDYRIQAMIILSGLPQSWDSVQGSILANHDMADLSISVIMPILQEEWQRRQARRGEQKSSHLARGGMHGAPQRQHWQGNQNNSGYTPQAGPSNYNSGYKPAPYKKFGKKPNYKPNNQNPGYISNASGSKGPNGPNWERNRQNRQNKKQARMLLKEQVAKLESQSKPDTKGKKKEKAGKSANLLARIDDIPLESRMEDIDSYNERVFIAPKSNKTDVVKQIVDEMEVDNEDAVSLGNDSVYSNARDFYASNALDGDD